MKKTVLVVAALALMHVATSAAKTPPPNISLTLAANPLTVVFGNTTTLSGTIAPAEAGQSVTIKAMPCGQTALTRIATVTTTTGGAYSFVARPLLNTTYQASIKQTSPAVTVKVAPRIVLRKITTGRFSVRVLAAQSFAGKPVVLQRYSTATGTWLRVRSVTLVSGGTTTLPVNPTTVSKASFRARIKARTRLRMVLTATQAAPCYVAGRSNVVRA